MNVFGYRVLIWLGLAVLAVAGTYLSSLAFEPALIRQLFGPKLTFLGLVIAAGTFQYRVWRDFAEWAEAQLNNPRRLELERMVQAFRGSSDARLVEYEAQLEAWRSYGNQTKKVIVEHIPHNYAILGNFLFVGFSLLVSSLTDVLLLVFQTDLLLWRSISTGLLGFSLVPFFEIAGRYFFVLSREFRHYGQRFQPPAH